MAKGKDEGLDQNSTVQMSSEELARLHAELEGKALAAASAQEPRPAKAEAPSPSGQPRAAKPAEAPRKADPARYHEPQGGGGLLIVGGIGALLAGIAPAIGVVPMFQGMGDMLDLIFVAAGVAAVGHLLTGLGTFGATSRTGGVAALVGTLHVVAMLGLTFFLLAAFQIIPLEGDLLKLAMVAPTALPGTAWLLSGIWALSATSAMGVMGVLHGIFALLGGGAAIGMVVGGLAGAFSPQEDIAIALTLGGIGATLLAATFLAVAFFGRLRRAPYA